MTTPPGIDKLWKNCTWINEEEKLAFFNHYFKNSKMVVDRIESEIRRFKDDLIEFITIGKVKDKDKERQITMNDIIERIKER